MRKFIFIIIIGLSLSCKKDKGAPPCPQPNGGSIIAGDSVFKLQEHVIIENLGKRTTGIFHDATPGYLFLVHLLDERLTLNPDTTLDVKYYSQHIPMITIPCYSSDSSKLVLGNYTFSNSQPHPFFTFSRSLIVYNYIYEFGGGTFNYRYPDIQQGDFTYKHICDDTYSISVNAMLVGGGRFQGTTSANIINVDSR